MDLNEILELRNTLQTELEALVETGKSEERKLSEVEEARFSELTNKIEKLDFEINEKNKINEININKRENKNMKDFKELIVRNGDKVESFNVEMRDLVLSSGIDDVQVAGNISTVGYTPFYSQIGCEILPNLTSSIKLPYIGNVIAAKKGEGERNDNSVTPSTVTLQPERFTLTETVGKEILAVGNEAAFQAFLAEMSKGVDKAITKEVFDVALAGATEVTGLTAYTTSYVDDLVEAVDGDVALLMPRAEFYKAKGVKADAGSGLFLANKRSAIAGEMWDGTPLFYSNLFSGSTVVAGEMKHVTIGEFGSNLEVIIDQVTKAPEGQVVITVCKLASVKLRNASAVRKATFA